jgi:hypothetical protein
MYTTVEPTTTTGLAAGGFDTATSPADLLANLPADGVGVDGLALVEELFTAAQAIQGALLRGIEYVRRTECFDGADIGLKVPTAMVRRLGIAPSEAAQLVSDAQNLTEHGPQVLDALCQGQVSARVAHKISSALVTIADDVKAVRKADPHRVFLTTDEEPYEPVPAAQKHLLAIAANREIDNRCVQRATVCIRDLIGSDLAQTRALGRYERRYLFLTHMPDGWKLDAFLDEVTGLRLKTMLDAASAPPADGDIRCGSERRHDDFGELTALTARFIDADDKLFDKAGQRSPHLRITINEQTLTTPPGAQPRFPAQRTPQQWEHAGVRTDFGHSLPPEAVRQIACQATVRGLIFDTATGEALQGGRRRRLPTDIQRDAVFARDGHCRFPACDRSTRWCDVHHRIGWQYGGLTDAQDLVAVCNSHHHLIEVHEQTLIRGPDGIDRIVPLQEALRDFYNRPVTR